MSDTFTNEQVDNTSGRVAGMNFHHGAMNFSVQYSVPNKVDSMLKNTTSYTEDQAARRGKFSITGESVETIDVSHSTVAADWEERNDKAVTNRQPKIALNFDIAADFDLLGKVISDLQKDYGVSVNSIIATLKYITDYTGFSGDPELQEGNFLAFKVDYPAAYTTLTVQFDGKPEQVMDSDRTHVQRFGSAPVGKSVIVRAYNGDTLVDAKKYDLSQIKLEPKTEP